MLCPAVCDATSLLKAVTFKTLPFVILSFNSKLKRTLANMQDAFDVDPFAVNGESERNFDDDFEDFLALDFKEPDFGFGDNKSAITKKSENSRDQATELDELRTLHYRQEKTEFVQPSARHIN
jgi:hypothetical protein